MGLLDRLTSTEFLTSPQTALAAGLLSPTPQGSFGGGLQQGITSALAAQRANLLNQIRQEQLAGEIAKRQQAARARQLFSQALGTRPTQFQPDTFPGESPSGLSGQPTGGLLNFGTGALADNQISTKELQGLALDQLRIGNVAGANSVIGFINATTPNTKTELAIAAADGDETAREALAIINGTETIKPLSAIAKINRDLENGLITQEQANQMINAVGRSPGFKEQYMAPILMKMAKGIPLSSGEESVRDFFKTTDPFDQFFRAAMSGTSGAEAKALQDARDAINKGANPEAVRQRLREKGIDPGKLDISTGVIQR